MQTAADASSLEAMEPHQRILLEQRLLARRKTGPAHAAIPRRGNSEPCALSFAQSRLWVLEQLNQVAGNYNITRAYRIRGALNVEALRAALGAVLERHEALRTRFRMQSGVPHQVVVPYQPLAMQTIDLRECADSTRELDGFVQRIAFGAFDLAAEDMLRAGVARLDEQEFALVIALHHIAADGWSLGVLDRELEHFYTAFDRGLPAGLPPLPLQYSDFSEWQRDTLRGEALERQLAYWRRQLAGLPALELPADRPRPAHPSYRGDKERFTIPAVLVTSLRELARARGATLYMTLLAAFQVLLLRYAGQEDVAVGAPIAGRKRTEIEGLIGFFVNTLVMRGDLSGNPTFSKLLTRTRERAIDAYSHQDLPFEKLVEELRPERDLSRNPLFQVMFSLENAPESEPKLPGLAITRLPLPRDTAKFDLTLSLTGSDGALEGAFEFSTDLFDASTIARMAGHFRQLLEGIAADPERGIAELPMLTAAELHQLQVQWNDTASDYPKDRCIPDLFHEQAARHPDAVALVHGDDLLTYRELDARANRLARHLRSLGAGPEAAVGICMERSPDLVAGMLGVLKAGGAYVPLDPNYPRERLSFMLRDTDVRVILTHRALLDQLPAHDSRVVCLDRDAPVIDACSSDRLPPATAADALAYVIYTSGSTGQPKGVMVPHRGVARLVCNTNYVQLGTDDCVAHLSNPSFDAATFEVWGALLNGARLAIIPREIALDPPRLVAQLRRDGITVLFLTTALFNAIVRFQPGAFAGVKHVLFGGEAVDPRWVRECLAAGAPGRLLHVYGPTETVTFATWHQVEAVAADERTIPIGRPIANMRLAVLDRHRQPVPVGVTGELYIGGDGLAHGYWRRPDLTAERFVLDPFATGTGARMYRTGDLVRQVPDGNIVFLGRLDQQVKLRGFRIEPGEIEAALLHGAPLREALVVLREDSPGDRRLVAYVVAAAAAPTDADLRTMLKAKLPEYMLPAAFVALPALPLTPNGKIDRMALPAPASGRDGNKSDCVAPRDSTELHLVKIWEDLLNLGPIGMRDNFFEVGGHSLLAVQLMDRIEKAFHRRLPLDTLWFRGGTVEALARILRDESPSGPEPEIVAMKKGSRRPLFVVHTMGGNLFHYYDLARRLDAEQTVYGLQARGVYGAGCPDHTVEAIAAHCIDSMRTVQPDGPYLVAGFSSGGVVAFEMAQQLAAARQPVALLALLDTYPPQAGTARIWIEELNAIRRRKLKLRHLQELAYFSVLHLLNLDGLRRMRTVGEAHRWAHWSYRPRPYAHPIAFFVAKVSAERAGADNLGWIRWANDNVRIHRLPGNHGDLVKPPVVDELATLLQACIDGVAGS
jgi:amino acid adenylation domain-containing protein